MNKVKERTRRNVALNKIRSVLRMDRNRSHICIIRYSVLHWKAMDVDYSLDDYELRYETT